MHYLKQSLLKKTINIFLPPVLLYNKIKIHNFFDKKGRRNLIRTFRFRNIFYKIFYFSFTYISLIKVFFKDKKIFYNFSKYFQLNLYIFLIKKKQLILNLFFHFFYTLFITFENYQDFFYNILFYKGYRIRHKKGQFKSKIKKIFKNLTIFTKKVNSLSLFLLTFNLYKNTFFFTYNNLIINNLIFKLFYYFKLLNYKSLRFKFRKKYKRYEYFYRKRHRLLNERFYNILNGKLIKLFSFYQSHLRVKQFEKNNVLFLNNSLNQNMNVKILKKNQFLIN